MAMQSDPVLTIHNLQVALAATRERPAVAIVRGIDLAIGAGEILALVGESGCGKSMTALAALGLLPPGCAASGAVRLSGTDLLALPEPQRARLRGNRIAMIFQEPMTALNPVMPVGRQVAEVLEQHHGLDRRPALVETVHLFDRVGLPQPRARLSAFPFELSGGQRQRVMIAMALACGPAVLLADEPTTALDVTVQARILDLMVGLVAEAGMALLLITHDLGVVAETADRVAVMYAGRIIEIASVARLFTAPAHPYTRGLLSSLPSAVAPDQPLATIPGTVPDPTSISAGCAFAPRCPRAGDVCSQPPPLAPVGPDHAAACLRLDAEVPA